MTAVLFDRAHFDHMTGGDSALQEEVLALFRQQADAMDAALRLEAGSELWRTAAHTLKGSARGIGLFALAQACEAAEATGGAAALEEARAALRAALEAILERGGARSP